MTSAGEIEELTGGVIPKEAYTVTFAAENGTVTPETISVANGGRADAVFTASDYNAKVTATCGQATKEIIFEIFWSNCEKKQCISGLWCGLCKSLS